MTSRTSLDWLVFDRIWTNLQNHVEHEYGQIDGYLSRAVETAMREAINEHRYADVEEKIQTLVDTVGAKKTDGATSSFEPSEYSGKTRATVYVDKSLLAQFKEYADNSQYSYGVKLSQTLLYFLEGGRPDSLVGQLDRALEEIEREQDDSMTTTDEIADRLGERFTKDEFLEAAEASGVGTDKYALEQYLPKILDELDVYPHPGDEDLFLPMSSATIPDTPDPATLPYQAMDDDDKRLALKAAALRKVGETSTGLSKFTATDGVDALGGRPRHSTVRPLLRDIARESEGFVYDDEIPGLRVDRGDAVRANYDNEAALDLVGWLQDDTPDIEPTDDGAGSSDPAADTVDKWVETAVDHLEDMPSDIPDVVVDNKIARARYPDEVDDVEGPPDKLLERVTSDERNLVREQLDWTGETDEDTVRDDAADEWERLDEATIATDGGVDIGQLPE